MIPILNASWPQLPQRRLKRTMKVDESTARALLKALADFL
jgi:hypothetical protein